MTRRNSIVLGIACVGAAGALGYAIRASASGIPSAAALSYAGVLEDAAGPITGTHNIQVILYDAATAGNNLCQSTTVALKLTDGHFSVPLPDGCTTAVGANANAWVDVLVDGSDTGRTKIGAVPYAVEAAHAVSATNATNAAGSLAQQVVPAGAVMLFNLAACPVGWSEQTNAQGRYLVGMPSSGTLAGAVGTALANEENRPVGQHSHVLSDPGHAHGVSDPGHAHGASDPGHAHGVGAGTAFMFWNGNTCAGSNTNFGNGGNCVDAVGSTSIVGTGISIQGSTTNVSVNASTTGIAVANAGSIGGTNAPYIQFRVCQKN